MLGGGGIRRAMFAGSGGPERVFGRGLSGIGLGRGGCRLGFVGEDGGGVWRRMGRWVVVGGGVFVHSRPCRLW